MRIYLICSVRKASPEMTKIAEEILHRTRPTLGYLTISNALQWRLQYTRVIEKAGSVEGIERIR